MTNKRRLAGHLDLDLSNELRRKAKTVGMSGEDLQAKLDAVMASGIRSLETEFATAFMQMGRDAGILVEHADRPEPAEPPLEVDAAAITGAK